jgi:prepilin-type N-terminal cleavage/methylation domain-containing protein
MRKQEGFTLIELMVVILIIGILVAIAVPVFFAAQNNAQAGACKDNLRTIDSAIMQYSASESTGAAAYPATIGALVSTYIRDMPICKAAATGSPYTLSATTAAAPVPRALCNATVPHTY